MNYKKIGFWISVLALIGSFLAYAGKRDRDLTATETKQEQAEKERKELKEDIKSEINDIKKQVNQIYLLLINKEG